MLARFCQLKHIRASKGRPHAAVFFINAIIAAVIGFTVIA